MKYIAVVARNKSDFREFLIMVDARDRDQFRCVTRTEDIRGVEFSAFIRVGQWWRIRHVEQLIDELITRIR